MMPREKLIYPFVIIFLLISVYRGHAEVEMCEVQEFGHTKKEAIINGLLEAIRQIKGTRIQGEEKLRSIVEEVVSTDEWDTANLHMKSRQSEDISLQTHGYIKSYKVIKAKFNKARDGWDVILRVYIPIYKAIKENLHDTRPRLAVMPFRTTKASFFIEGRHVAAQEVSRRFTQRLVNELTQSRKFLVLDREYFEEYLHEKKLILSEDTPIEEQVRIGHILGVDYLLVGTISNLKIEETSQLIKILGKRIHHTRANLQIDYRIIYGPTRQIKWANSISIDWPPGKNGADGACNLKPLVDSLLCKGAKAITQEALSNIYPIRVADILSDGHIVLNQGGITISEGDLLDVFNLGKIIVDPYTKQPLGQAEVWSATIKVDKVLPKLAYARIVKGDKEKIKINSICRRVKYQHKVKKHKIKRNQTQKMKIPW